MTAESAGLTSLTSGAAPSYRRSAASAGHISLASGAAPRHCAGRRCRSAMKGTGCQCGRPATLRRVGGGQGPPPGHSLYGGRPRALARRRNSLEQACDRRAKRGHARSAGLTFLREMRRPAIVPDVIKHCQPRSVRGRGPAASVGFTSLTSDAAPCHRTGCDQALCRPSACGKGGQQRPQALHFLRSMRRPVIVPDAIKHGAAPVRARKGASSIRRPYISYERCGALPSCRM